MVKQSLYNRYKLLKHTDRIFPWASGEITYPIFVNINLTNKCNNFCPKCTTKNKDGITMETYKAREIIREIGEKGVKSIGFGGGGDPTCHPALEELVGFVKQNRMDVAMTTNGFNLPKRLIDAITDYCTWIRISLDADSPEIYKKTHGMNEKAFFRVIENIKNLTKSKRDKKSDVVIGVTYLVGPETIGGIYPTAKLCKSLGVDNLRFRPFFNWGDENCSQEEAKKIMGELERSKEFDNDTFSVSYPPERCDSLSKEKKRNYQKCYIHHFNPIITPDGKVYPCCFLIDNEQYCFGDLTKNSFEEIWKSEDRKKAYEHIKFKDCPNPCMLDRHNELLWAIKHNQLAPDMNLTEILRAMDEPIPHENFF